jgi:hypothetical protein
MTTFVGRRFAHGSGVLLLGAKAGRFARQGTWRDFEEVCAHGLGDCGASFGETRLRERQLPIRSGNCVDAQNSLSGICAPAAIRVQGAKRLSARTADAD